MKLQESEDKKRAMLDDKIELACFLMGTFNYFSIIQFHAH